MPILFSSRWGHANSGSNPLTEAKLQFLATGQSLLDLTITNPTLCNLESPFQWELVHSSISIRKYHAQAQGELSTRQAIASYYLSRDIRIQPEDLFLTSGTSEAYTNLFRLLCDPGDEILVPSPSYPLLEVLSDFADLKLVQYHFVPEKPDAKNGTHWLLNQKSLRQGITSKTRAICVVSPNNPSGYVLSSADINFMLLLAEEFQLPIIVDEVFADFLITETKKTRWIQSEKTLIFTLNGLSKTLGLPQIKLAWIHVDGQVKAKTFAKQYLEWICDAFLSVSNSAQLACIQGLNQVESIRGSIQERIQTNLKQLQHVLVDSRIIPIWPEAGWCIPLQLDGIDDELFAVALMTQGVAVQPGYFFDFTVEDIIVISLLTPPLIFKQGIEIIARRYQGAFA